MPGPCVELMFSFQIPCGVWFGGTGQGLQQSSKSCAITSLLLGFRSSYPQQSLPCQWLYCTAGSEFWQMFIWYRERNTTQIPVCDCASSSLHRGHSEAEHPLRWVFCSSSGVFKTSSPHCAGSGSANDGREAVRSGGKGTASSRIFCASHDPRKNKRATYLVQEGNALFSTKAACLTFPSVCPQHAEHHWPSWEWGGTHHCWILGRTWHIVTVGLGQPGVFHHLQLCSGILHPSLWLGRKELVVMGGGSKNAHCCADLILNFRLKNAESKLPGSSHGPKPRCGVRWQGVVLSWLLLHFLLSLSTSFMTCQWVQFPISFLS